MRFRLKFRCDLSQGNNGIVQAQFTKASGPPSQDQVVLFNVLREHGLAECDKEYWISIEPAYPHRHKGK